jgi:hypothetical protein
VDPSICRSKRQQLLTPVDIKFWQRSKVLHFLAAPKIDSFKLLTNGNAEEIKITTKTEVIDDDIIVKLNNQSTLLDATNTNTTTSVPELTTVRTSRSGKISSRGVEPLNLPRYPPTGRIYDINCDPTRYL